MMMKRQSSNSILLVLMGNLLIPYVCAFFSSLQQTRFDSDWVHQRTRTNRLSPLYFQTGRRSYSFVTRRSSSNYNSGGTGGNLAWDNDNFLNALSQGTTSSALQKANDEYQQQAQYNMKKRRSLLAKKFPSFHDDDDDNDMSFAAAAEEKKEEDLDLTGEVAVPPHLIKKPVPVDEENPAGGQMFRKMLEKAQAGNMAKRAMNAPVSQPQQQQSQQQLYAPVATPPMMPSMTPPNMATMNFPTPQQQQQQQPPNMYMNMDPQQAYYQAQLQAWQQQMMAFAQLSAINPQAAASMTLPPPPPPPPSMMMMTMNPMGIMGGGMPTNNNMPTPTYPIAATSTPTTTTADNKPQPSVQEFIPKPPQQGKANRDSYDIANPSDVYFAQLKRDSTVRTLARRAGDVETANKPFADEGVQALKNYFSETLTDARKEVREKSNDLFTTSREEMLLPPSKEEYVDEATKQLQLKESGVKYKQLMEQKLKRKSNEWTAKSLEELSSSQNKEPSVTYTTTTPSQPLAVVSSFPFLENIDASAVNTRKPVSVQSQSPSPSPVPTITRTQESSTPTEQDLEENRKMIRSLMGLLLKHRGGPGFGAGRLKSPEDTKLEENFLKVLQLIKSEVDMVESVETTALSSLSSSHDSPIGGALECVQAVLTMYKSADRVQQDELLIPIRDALKSAVNALNQAITENETKKVTANVQSTLEFPEKYEFSTETRDSSADETSINEEKEEEEEDDIDSTTRLQEIYKKLQSYQGDEKFGVKKMSSNEISSLSDVLSDMRGILMNELGS